MALSIIVSGHPHSSKRKNIVRSLQFTLMMFCVLNAALPVNALSMVKLSMEEAFSALLYPSGDQKSTIKLG
jgi:ribosome biogenesis protein Tsr3